MFLSGVVQIGQSFNGGLALGFALAAGGGFPRLIAGRYLDGEKAVVFGAGDISSFVCGNTKAAALGVFL